MLRFLSISALVAAAFCLNGFKGNDPFGNSRPFPYNSIIANIFFEDSPVAPDLFESAPEGDSAATATRVLLLQYSVYDSLYASRMRSSVQSQLPNSIITEFWDASPESLLTLLNGQDIVVAAYPSNGQSTNLKTMGKYLLQFASQGGGVVFTGTHEFGVLQQFGLIDIDYGYYCKDPNIKLELANTQNTQSGHPIANGLPDNIHLQNYAYPLDVSDPLFITLAEMRGYPVLGYKPVGMGKVVYLGVEFYHDETETNKILQNTLRWLAPSAKCNPTVEQRQRQRKEEYLYAGTRNTEKIELLVYPNPYVSKATLDVELTISTAMSVNVTDEMGRLVQVLLPRKNLQPGLYRFELSNLPAGIYFIQCRTGEDVTVKRVVKSDSR